MKYHYSYEQGLVDLGCEIVHWGYAGDFQGDHIVLLEKDGLYAYTTIGYGSCSGCDIMMGYDDDNDEAGAKQEIQDVYDCLVWETLNDIADYLENHDWEGDYIWHAQDFFKELDEMKSKVANLLCA